MSCCSPREEPEDACCGTTRRVDYLFWGSLVVVAAAYLTHLLFHERLDGTGRFSAFTHGVYELMNKMWWGLLIGIAALGLLSAIPREFVTSVLGRGGSVGGLFRATGAGLLLDLCNHGILMVGMKLYERGASLGQVFAFLIASPWNSFSLTLILFALIGVKWTLVIILLSAVVALVTGFVVDRLVAAGILPGNPNTRELPEDFAFFTEARARWSGASFGPGFVWKTTRQAVSESRMILRWILFGAILAAAIRALVPLDVFGTWFGPSLLGLALTFLAATIIEVCSEGSSPIAADLMNRAKAPGNGFAFLMAGASTDYTEIMALRETTRSWKATLALPLLTSPQILLLGWILNQTTL